MRRNRAVPSRGSEESEERRTVRLRTGVSHESRSFRAEAAWRLTCFPSDSRTGSREGGACKGQWRESVPKREVDGAVPVFGVCPRSTLRKFGSARPPVVLEHEIVTKSCPERPGQLISSGSSGLGRTRSAAARAGQSWAVVPGILTTNFREVERKGRELFAEQSRRNLRMLQLLLAPFESRALAFPNRRRSRG
eukprot:scaffold3928_cov257-Pinguiococcus_pyrenoidosus.AAC.11